MTAKIDGTNGVLQQYDYQTPASGFSYTFAAGTQMLFMVPAATLATGTITMPASPADGMVITFSSSQQITALTVQGNTGQSISSAATFLPAKGALSYVYRLSNTTWYPCQTVQTVPVVDVGIGSNQTWQNMLSPSVQRVANTTYTNTTGRAIMVAITTSTGSGSASFYINNVVVATQGGDYNNTNTFTFIIPSGNTYKISNSVNYWWELS